MQLNILCWILHDITTDLLGQKGIASAVFDHTNKCSHDNCNTCRKGIKKLPDAKEIARLWYILRTGTSRRKKFLFLFWSDYMFLLKHRGKWFLQTHCASLCSTNGWEDSAWGGREILKYSCTCALNKVCYNREELCHNPLQPVGRDEEVDDECILS